MSTNRPQDMGGAATKPSRVLVIALAEATLDLITPWVEAGLLPGVSAAIPGVSSRQHLREALAALEVPALTAEEMDRAAALGRSGGVGKARPAG